MFSNVFFTLGLQSRGDSDCTSGSYTSDNGLDFDVFCGFDLVGNDLTITTADGITGCANQCADFVQRNDSASICYSVAYDTGEGGRCVLKQSGFTSANLSAYVTTVVNAAIARSSQLTPLDTTCPYEDSSNQTTSNGLQFEIKCGKDFSGNDFSFTSYSTDHIHTNSLMECMEICSSNKPLCKAVAWEPDLKVGYGNCFPKSSNDLDNLVTTTHVVHTALAQLVYNTSCNDKSNYITSNGKTFHIACGTDMGTDDIIAFHQPDLNSCIEFCSTFKNSSLPSCQAISYAAEDSYGYLNCYLKSATDGEQAFKTNSALALLVSNNTAINSTTNNGTDGGSTTVGSDSNQTSGTNSPPSSSPPSSSAWIAGPVVGAIVGLALLAGLVYWWRKRQPRRPAQQGAPGEASSQEKYGAVLYRPVGTQPIETGPGIERINELEAQHELSSRNRH